MSVHVEDRGEFILGLDNDIGEICPLQMLVKFCVRFLSEGLEISNHFRTQLYKL